ncbi:MAG: adenylate kinase [Acidobacteria bacterium RIFCSPLOWO2_02_FULL_65_29]|nr:MAG: adenylate kinase [Acidobacteria bacterium RIFCSPLOWO2_02_FULL_65_29]
MNLIILGAPGAGKGTQAERVAKARRIPKISTGDILREAVQAGTDIGRRAKAIMDRGELVGDEVMVAIVKERLDRPDVAAGFLLDGFPRTVAQAQALDGIMEGRAPLVVVDIEVPEGDLVRRLSARLVCAVCGSNAATPEEAQSLVCAQCGGQLVQRSDDNEATIRERLAVYRAKTMPLIEYYRARPTFRSVDGADSPERVAEAMAVAVDGAQGVGAAR